MKNFPVNHSFMPGETFIPASGQVIGEREKELMHKAVDKGWLTASTFNREFEDALTRWIGSKAVRTVNSGSSANLVAFMALTSPKLGDRAIKKGDEVISVACGFPTTINPIIQAGAVPVFLDINTTLNIDTKHLESAVTDKTKAIFIAHTMGNPFNLEEIAALAKKHNLWLIEDCCDALGARWRNQNVGTFGDLATLSFFPAHHITMGEGGAVIINNTKLTRLVESFRDWGRDCWCEPGKDNTCKQRYCQEFEGLPYGYDHKYVFTHVGYNLKITEMQAACGVAQLEKLDYFISMRRGNYSYLANRLSNYEELWLPTVYPDAHPSWFGFPITLSPDAKFERQSLILYLNDHNIGTRLLFAGNATKQPFLKGQNYRVHGTLEQTDHTMHNTFWMGVQPSLTQPMLDYMCDTIDKFMKEYR
jgi:CDP-6-deoxy-D-xylo-4-hexulose-3-dehydrase